MHHANGEPEAVRRTAAASERRGRRRTAWAALAVLVVLAAGCGDDGATTAPSTTTPSTAAPSTTAPSTTAPSTSGAPPPSSTAPSTSTTTLRPSTTTAADNDAAVRAVFTTFFDGSASTDARVAALDDGERYRTMLADAASDPQGAKLRAAVRTVTYPPDTACAGVSAAPPCAIVTFDLLVGAFPALVSHQGAATKRSGTWKVTAATWCDVVSIGGDSCPSRP
jgi:hypothetical protein